MHTVQFSRAENGGGNAGREPSAVGPKHSSARKQHNSTTGVRRTHDHNPRQPAAQVSPKTRHALEYLYGSELLTWSSVFTTTRASPHSRHAGITHVTSSYGTTTRGVVQSRPVAAAVPTNTSTSASRKPRCRPVRVTVLPPSSVNAHFTVVKRGTGETTTQKQTKHDKQLQPTTTHRVRRAA